MNTNFTVFDPPEPTPPPTPAPGATVVPAPQPQVIVVQTPARAMFVAVLAFVLGTFAVGCTVGDYIASHRVPAPSPAPAPPNPAPSPRPLPPSPTPPPAPVVNAYTGPLCVSLVYDATSQADNTATIDIRKDASLPARLKADQVDWYILSPDEAASLNWTSRPGWTKTPTLVIQKPSDPGNLSFNPVPASSDELVALIAKYRGK